jgi:hypothetical protein
MPLALSRPFRYIIFKRISEVRIDEFKLWRQYESKWGRIVRPCACYLSSSFLIQVLMFSGPVTFHSVVFRFVTTCALVAGYQVFRKINMNCLHLKGCMYMVRSGLSYKGRIPSPREMARRGSLAQVSTSDEQ